MKLNLESLVVETFAIGTGAESLPAFGPTRNCETRETACTVPPME